MKSFLLLWEYLPPNSRYILCRYSGNSGNSGSNGSNGNGGNAAVVTGDSANIAGYLMALVAAGGIAVVTFFRRKRVK